ncbi:MAG: hypothetical protein BWX83_00218 [Candidatus Cloacimonetes bacterium ADurb.Bin117]|jgi:hypothetical protein|nr:hypothetical protein [Candidatus Cloacimonadota bacterium]NLH93853.1 hypothetical protein [Candidatus Cloacimonadota bacterium]OQB92261.1 MAG: hypothetical protein BWX83_00218 [Candidatus Cloacimonetes bacterium ADurb.Bin117]HQC47645.1 hypothetical protein [Candidatus Syntrophosphaera sp.]
MKTNLSQFKNRFVSRWSIVLLLLVFVGTGFARVGMSSGEINVPDSNHALQTTFDTQTAKTSPDYPDSAAVASGFKRVADIRSIHV